MIALLGERTWWMLRGVSLAYGLRFKTQQSKALALEQLRQFLYQGALKHAYHALTNAEREPLIALQSSNGALPLHTFTTRFGDIRPYRPWRSDSTRAPWKRPVSVAEKLWHLGLIEITKPKRLSPALVLLPDAVKMLLPLLSRPKPVPHSAQYLSPRRSDFSHDLAVLMGTLARGNYPLRRGRWFTPRLMRAINGVSFLPDPADPLRGEFRMGRLRFLHYTAQVAGLIDGTRITTAGWAWLNSGDHAPIERAIRADMAAHERVWDHYRLPPITPVEWDALTELIASLESGRTYQLRALQHQNRFQLPRSRTAALLNTVFSWLGMVSVQGDFICVCSTTEQPSKATTSITDAAIWIDLQGEPPLRPFAELLVAVELEDARTFKIDSAALRHAIERGYSVGRMLELLTALIGRPLDPTASARLHEWARLARRMTLRSAIMLTADPNVIAAMRADWRLRALLGETISPRHLLINPEDVQPLRKKLARRGLDVTMLESESGFTPAHLYPVARELPALTEVGWRGQIERAIATSAAVTIRYYSPYEDVETTRTIEPHTLYERKGTVYVEAWCQLEEEPRTFRLDRVRSLVTEQPSII